MGISNLTPAFVLRRNPFRESSLMLDLFTLEAGKITCVAKFSRRSGARTKGMLEPFRQLEASWIGRGEVFTLSGAEETHRYALPPGALARGLYCNELLLRALWQHQPQPELFAHYQQTLTRLQDPTDTRALPLFELEVLAMAGYELNLWHDDATGQDIQAQMRYRFRPEHGLFPDAADGKGVPVSGSLLVALREPESLDAAQQQELRRVLDNLNQMLLKGKVLNARRLIG